MFCLSLFSVNRAVFLTLHAAVDVFVRFVFYYEVLLKFRLNSSWRACPSSYFFLGISLISGSPYETGDLFLLLQNGSRTCINVECH